MLAVLRRHGGRLAAAVSLWTVLVATLMTTHAMAATRSATSIPTDHKRVCVHNDNYLSGIAQFASMVDRSRIDCAMVFASSADWSQMTDPWYLYHSDPDLNYAEWVRDSAPDDRRQLIISQPLIPDDLAGTDWLDAGARGAYDDHARRFAHNLVAAGVGDAIIRLAWEMNGNWYPDSIPDTPSGDAKWVRLWRHTVTAMRSVPGAHFRFDWCPNNGYRPIALSDYYPGDRYVDIIGDDAYDAGVKAGLPRWSTVLDRPAGLQTVIDFADAHHKPLSLPEWGVAPPSVGLAGGDDPAYVRGIAEIVAHHDVAFQCYFYNHEFATQLRTGARSLAAYRAAFGNGGYATGSENGTGLARVPDRSRRAVRGRMLKHRFSLR